MSHEHQHDHPDDTKDSLSFDEKLIKILEHWVKHNDDHARTYRDWAKEAKSAGMQDVAFLLEGAADMTLLISNKFDQAIEIVKK